MSEKTTESLHREFELERMILFSDAVFAIAITLLILEIKFPVIPENFNNVSVFDFFKPTLIHFFTFMLSFFFIGMSWARHLQLCKFLQQYNNTVIVFNLLLLFFIVIFPFSVSGFAENMHASFFVPAIIYILNIFFVIFAQFLFVHYILKRNTALTISGNDDEKKYFYLRSKYNFVMMFSSVVVILGVGIISRGNMISMTASLYVLPVFALIMKMKLKKHKPKKSNNLSL
jgi:uncharacterized membrane protein